jgi:hypothetical protein
MIVFHSMEHSISTPMSIANGAYTTDRAPIGKNSITVDTRSVKAGNPAAYVLIPEKYREPETSGLATEIKPGMNENVDFKLKK